MDVPARKTFPDGIILKLFRIYDVIVDYNIIGIMIKFDFMIMSVYSNVNLVLDGASRR